MRTLTKYQERFIKRIEEFVLSLGATRDDYYLNLDTPLGPLRIRVHENWIHCRWQDVEKAKKYLGDAHYSRLNPYSGKWNWIYHDDAATLDSAGEGDAFHLKLKEILSLQEVPNGN